MPTVTGTIARIDKPYKTPRGKQIQEIALKREERVYLYPQIHRNFEMLNGLMKGDFIEIDFEIYGKEKEKFLDKIHFHTIVIKSIKKLK